MERKVIVKWSCLAETWGSWTQTLLSLTIPRCLSFLASASWCYFYPAFIGKQGVELVPVDSDSGALWYKGVRDSFKKLMKVTGFLLRKM